MTGRIDVDKFNVSHTYDAFICHASEDKSAVARPLALALQQMGHNVWFDEISLTIGDSLRRKIDEGLKNSRFGVVILSENFFKKNWPQYELDGLTSKELLGQKVIIPVWHKVSEDDVRKYSLSLADRVAVDTEDMQKVIAAIDTVLSKKVVASIAMGDGGFENAWFQKYSSLADKSSIESFWELRCSIQNIAQQWKQDELLRAMSSSAIRTFGWPVGACLDSKDLRPKPTADGILVLIDNGRYQMWCTSLGAQFYFREPFILEDDRRPNKDLVYFNTRLVRITEGFLRYAGLCDLLRVEGKSNVRFRIKHSGLRGRRLCRTGNEGFLDIEQRDPSNENEITAEIGCKLIDIRPNIVSLVKEVVEPLFLLFDFSKIPESIIEDIVTSFVNGKCK